MVNYASTAQVGAMVGISITSTSVPNTTHLAVMLDNADGIINAFLDVTADVTDGSGVLQNIACHLIQKMINNFFAMRYPDRFEMMEVSLTEEDKKLINRAQSNWSLLSWEMGID